MATISFAAPSKFRKSGLSDLLPLVQDLATEVQPESKFKASTYQIDDAALQERLKDYSFYDPKQLGGLAEYLAPKAAATYQGNLVFKPTDFEAAVRSAPVPAQPAQQAGVVAPPNQEQLISDWLNKLYTGRTREEVYDQPVDESGMHGVLARHMGQTPTLKTAIELAKEGYQQRNVPTGGEDGSYKTEWYRVVPEATPTVEEFLTKYGATPEGGWSDENTKGRFVANRNIYGGSDDPLQKWLEDKSYLPNFSLYGSGSQEDIQRGFNILQRMAPQNIHEFWMLKPEAQRGMLENPAVALQQMRALANPSNKDWLSIGAEGGFRDINAYDWDKVRGLKVDPSQYMKIKNEGPFGDNFITDILDNPVVNTALSVIPVTAPYMAAYNAVNALHNDNPLGAALSAAGGIMSATGTNPASFIGQGANEALGLTLGKAGEAALGGGLYGAGMGALQGGDLKSALTGAVTGGLGSYASSTIPDLTKGMSPLTQYMAKIGAQTGIGGLGSLLSGRDLRQGALSGLIGGTAGAIGEDVGKTYGKTFGNITSPLIRQMLTKQLYKV